MQDSIRKFKFRDNGIILNAPTAIEAAFETLGYKTSLDPKVKSPTRWFSLITAKNM
jgi:hypothetical protein